MMLTEFPIARWRCRNKSNKKLKQRTFSLLPDCLVPYQRFDLTLIQETLDHLTRQDGTTYRETIDFISLKGLEADIPLETYQIRHFYHLFNQAFIKLSANPAFTPKSKISHHPVKAILNLIKDYQSPFQTTVHLNIPNICQLAWDFFWNMQSETYMFRHFIFGTPYQKRV